MGVSGKQQQSAQAFDDRESIKPPASSKGLKGVPAATIAE
jgi:hypothetical protein